VSVLSPVVSLDFLGYVLALPENSNKTISIKNLIFK
jgi:hypothetical protein